MNILMLTPYLPYPLFSGGQIRTYNLLKNLSKKHRITLFALIKHESERAFIPELEKYCHKVRVFKRSERPFTLRNIVRAGFSSFPFLVIRNLVHEVIEAVRKELQKEQYDLIHAETFYMMPNIPKTRIPVLLVEQTIEYLGYLSFTKSSKWWFLKPLFYLDIEKIRKWEEYYWKNSSRLIVMSEEDKAFIQDSTHFRQTIDVVANGVDADYFKETQKKLPKDPTVLFVGTFRWLPNVEAVRFLVNDVWPLVKHKIPNASLHVVGNSPTQEVYELAKDRADIRVSGNIADIRDAYSTAHVLVAPVFSGKGTRYKVLEALATKTPVVGTELAVEGLNIEPGKQALIGDTAKEIAKHTIAVLENPELRRRLGENGERFVFREYNWEHISQKLNDIYREVAEQKIAATSGKND